MSVSIHARASLYSACKIQSLVLDHQSKYPVARSALSLSFLSLLPALHHIHFDALRDCAAYYMLCVYEGMM